MESPGILLVKEAMVVSLKYCFFFGSLDKRWEMSVVDSHGCSRGLVTIWNTLSLNFKRFLTCVGILLMGSFSPWSIPIDVLNCYTLYSDRMILWELAKKEGILCLENLVLGGILF